MRSRMSFQLIKTKSYTITRHTSASTIVNGKWLDGVVTPTIISALITPQVKRDIIDILPEALRKQKTIRIMTNDILYDHNSQQGYEADEITYSGHTYRIFKLGDWNDVSGYTGREAYAVQVDTKDLELLVQVP